MFRLKRLVLVNHEQSTVGATPLGAPRRWAARGGLAVADQAVLAGTNFAVSVLLARWLTPTLYGAFSVALAFSWLLRSLYDALVNVPMTVFGAGRHREHFRSYLGTLLRAQLQLTLPLVGLLVLAAVIVEHLVSTSVGGALLGLALASPPMLLLWSARSAFYAELRVGASVAGGAVYCATSLAALAWLHTRGWLTPASAFAALGLGAGLGVLLTLRRLRPDWTGSGFSVHQIAIEHWGYGRWALADGAVAWLALNIYYLVLPVWHGLAGTAALRAVMNFTLPGTHTLMALGAVLLPTLVGQRRAAGVKAMTRHAWQWLGIFLALTTVYLGALWVLRNELFVVFYGGKYGEHAGSLLWVGLVPVSASFGVVLACVLQALERPDLVFWSQVGSAVTALTIGLGLATVWGVDGAIAGLVLSYAAGAALRAQFSRKLIRSSSLANESAGAQRSTGAAMGQQVRWITDRDYDRSQTTHMLPYLHEALRPLHGQSLRRLLDIGCGFGGLTRLVADHLGIGEAHGVDVDAVALEEARDKGVVTQEVDIRQGRLPFPDDSFDLVTSFGVLDYLPDFDPMLREIYRVLRPGSYALISLPNLAGWQNRLSLLLGYQLRDVEVSREKVVGVHHWYALDGHPVGHIHTVTVPAFRQLMEHHGFGTVRITAGVPQGRQKGVLVRWVDRMLSRRVTLARRFFYLGQRGKDSDRWRSP